MLIIDNPYISDFLIKTIKKNKLPVLKNDFSKTLTKSIGPNLITEEDFISKVKKTEKPKIYTTSENAIGWISKHLSFKGLPEKIDLFKDKIKFRELTTSMYPDFYFKEIKIDDLERISVDEILFPFIIKPSVGFFSMGVYKVSNKNEWEQTKKSILAEIKSVENLYPKEVLNTNTFIIEEYVEGNEFAFDAYYDEHGNPVLLNTFKHYFANDNDVSDRVYFTSKKIIEKNYQTFTGFLKKLGKLAKVKNFPVHVEVRLNKMGQPIPIEVNPLRFGGWCTTADLTFFAFGFNPYEYFLKNLKPDWKSILSQMNDNLYSVIVLNNSTGKDTKNIKSFDYDLLCSQFSKVLELRKINYKEFPVFGFLFAETNSDSFSELEKVSASPLEEYIQF